MISKHNLLKQKLQIKIPIFGAKIQILFFLAKHSILFQVVKSLNKSLSNVG